MCDQFEALPTRYLTRSTPGVGGSLKERPEDFVVEEIPLYEPCGVGEHLYLLIEKRGRATLEVVREIAGHFRVPVRAVGYAGMKDKHAVTRQYLSVHTRDDRAADSIDIRGVTVLDVARHRNKLRVGQLRGNRFSVRIRGVDPKLVPVIRATVQQLALSGAPNFAGEQRFGFNFTNHLIGRTFLKQDWQQMCHWLLGAASDEDTPDHEARVAFDQRDPARAALLWSRLPSVPERRVADALAEGLSAEDAITRHVTEAQGRFFVTAFQSAVFNQILAERMDTGQLDRLVPGDVAWKHRNEALFVVSPEIASDPATAKRLTDFEISPSGPLWGHDMLPASGAVGRLENDLLSRTGVSLECFDQPPHDVAGARRPLRMPIRKPVVESGDDEFGPFILVGFDLPKGSFATVVLDEIMKLPKRSHPWGGS